MSFGSALIRPLRDLVPAARPERRYALVSLVNSVGNGLFVTGTVVFATRVVGLSASEVGLAVSATGVAGFLAAGTMGVLADRFGARRMMSLLCVLEGIGYLLYCFTGSFASFTALACLVAVVGFGKTPANAALVSAITSGEDRVRLRAQSRSLNNLGFSLGAALAAVSLAVGTMPAYYLLPVGAAAMLFAAALVVRRLPEIRAGAAASRRRSFTALRSVPFLTTTVLTSVLSMHASLILVVVPLWIVERTPAPHALIGILLVVNTAMVVLFQVRASAGADTVGTGVRKARWAALVLLPGCLALGLSGGAPVAPTVVLAVAGCVLLTVGEMLQSASAWAIGYSLAPAHAHAEYLGAFGMSIAGQSILGPAIGTWAVLTFGLAGWAAFGLAFVLAAAVLGPVARWTSARLASLHTDPVPAVADAGPAASVARERAA